MPRNAILMLLLMMAALPANAQDIAKPAEISGVIHAGAPYGTGSSDYMGFTVYDASLWTDADSWSIRRPFALSLHYAMHLTAEDIVRFSLNQMHRIDPVSAEQEDEDKTILGPLIPDVKDDDRITALYLPGRELRFYFNGQLTGATSDMGFARRFLDIWFSEATPAPELRHQLLHLPEP